MSDVDWVKWLRKYAIDLASWHRPFGPGDDTIALQDLAFYVESLRAQLAAAEAKLNERTRTQHPIPFCNASWPTKLGEGICICMGEIKRLYEAEAKLAAVERALSAAFRWLYADTLEHVRGKKPEGANYDGKYLNDLEDMRAGFKALAREPG